MSLTFEPGLAQRFRSLTECVASGVYAKGLGRVASLVDVAPSHLSAQLSGGGEGNRKLSVDALEAYIQHTGDLTPIFYLVDRFCGDPAAQRQEALSKLAVLASELPAMLAAAGIGKAKR